MKRRGLLIILSSPSGAGKSTLAHRLMDWDPTLTFSVSATTRPPRDGEVDGKDYRFMDDAGFRALVNDGKMLEHAHVFGHFYGSPEEPVREAIDAGRDVLFDIDWQGAEQIKMSALKDHVLSVFVLPPSIDELHRRLVSRGKDSPETISKRMQKSWDEISHWHGYDYVLVNDDLDTTFAKLTTIIEAERLRQAQQPDIFPFIRRLQTEFEEAET